MALPKIKSPIFELTLPSNGAPVKYRPFLVKEQKLLLMALESEEPTEMFRAIKQIINNCSIDEIDVDDMPMFDLEFFFLKLRAKSIGEIIDLQLRHPNGINSEGVECSHATPTKLNLMDVAVVKDPNHSVKIMLDEETKIGIVLKYPTVAMSAKSNIDSKDQSQMDTIVEIVCNSIDYIFDAEAVYPASETSKAELLTFVNDLNQEQFAKLTSFFSTIPKLKQDFDWKCSKCGCKEHIELEGMTSFFG
jgi:hypothetical protein